MKIIKDKGFTLIELIAVLVIMAILALIVPPLVMSNNRTADKRSIDAYGRSIELAIAGYLLDTGSFPTSIEQLTIEYSGDEVVCTTTLKQVVMHGRLLQLIQVIVQQQN